METITILEELKNGLRGVRPELKNTDFGSCIDKEKNYKEYYLKDFKKNLYDDPEKIKLGTGSRAVKSSAAFIYNIFGKDEISIDGTTYGIIKYEDKLEALVNRTPAHLDGRLLAKDNSKVIYFETKLLEWSGTPKNLSLSYLDEHNYPEKNHHPDIFKKYFDSICKQEEKKDKNGELRRNHKSKVYDVIQMTIHILGIYNAVCKGEDLEDLEKKIPMPDKIELVNLVWDYDCPRYNTEAEEADKYISELNNKFAPLFKEYHKEFTVKYISFSDFMNNYKVEFRDPARKQYLTKRYLLKKS